MTRPAQVQVGSDASDPTVAGGAPLVFVAPYRHTCGGVVKGIRAQGNEFDVWCCQGCGAMTTTEVPDGN